MVFTWVTGRVMLECVLPAITLPGCVVCFYPGLEHNIAFFSSASYN